jgi:roadblock/LC7 domain-containing protein
MRHALPVILLALLLAGCGDSMSAPSRTPTTKPIVTAAPATLVDGSLTATRDCRHIGYVIVTGGQQAAVVDGWEIGRYGQVRGLAFAPDSKRYAFIATAGGKSFLVVDGKREAAGWAAIAWLRFSPDGKRIAYLASHGDAVDEASRASLVVDGQVVGTHKAVAEDSTLFSPDGARFSYTALGEDGQRTVFVDGEPGPAWEMAGLTAFSDDGRHAAYAAKEHGVLYIVLDGQKGPPLAKILQSVPFRFRPGSGEVVYPAQINGEWRMFAGGQWEVGYGYAVGLPVFSKDGRHMAYVAQREGELKKLESPSGGPCDWSAGPAVAVIDGRVGPEYASIDGIALSDNGKSVGYTGWRDHGLRVVVNGKELGPFKEHGAGVPLWNADGSRYAFYASADEEGKTCIVTSAGKGRAYDEVKGLRWSPCGRWLVYAARRGTTWCVVINGSEGQPHDEVLAELGGGIVFDSPTEVRYLVKDMSTYSVVDEELH